MTPKNNTNSNIGAQYPDVFRWFFICVIAFTIGGYIIHTYGLANQYWISAGIIFCLIIIVWCLHCAYMRTTIQTHSTTLSSVTGKPIPGSIHVQPGTFPDSTQSYYGTEIPIMGPLDGLAPTDVVTRMNYLYEKTSYPYRTPKFTDYETTADTTLQTQGSSLLKGSLLDTPATNAEMARWYPNTTRLQVSARDCTNYAAGDPLSCNMDGRIYQLSAGSAPTNAVTQGKLLDNRTEALAEGFENMNSVPKSLSTLHEFPVLFKNSGATVVEFDAEHLHPIGTSGDMCRTCTVGRCTKGTCGSRVFEPGNDNIINVANYVRDYLADDVPFTGPVPAAHVPGDLRLARG
jgi:hypothetical protein